MKNLNWKTFLVEVAKLILALLAGFGGGSASDAIL